MQHKIIYIYDALCGWCYGFSPVMAQLKEQFDGQLHFEVMSAGMITGIREGIFGEISPYIKKAYPNIERATGIGFGKPFLENILSPGTAYFSSEMPGIAMTAFRNQLPEQVVEFAQAMQNALFRDGIELSVLENYRPLVEQFGLSGDDFIAALQSDENRYETLLEFQTVANWGVTEFPSVLLKPAHEEHYYMIARGFTPLEKMQEIISKVIPELDV